MLEHQHVGLIAAHGREDVVRPRERSEPLGLAECGHGLVVTSELRERDARERMDERKVTPIARCEERRCSLGEMFANDGRVTDLAVTLRQLETREADGA